MPIHCSICVLSWKYDYLNGEAYQQKPQNAHPCAEGHHMRYRSQKRSIGVTCAHDEVIKKTKKNVYLPRPPMLLD